MTPAGERARRATGGSGTAIDIASAAQLACLLEVSAPKPGNVSPAASFADTAYGDFLASAAAIGGPMARAGEQPLGVTIRAAVEATSEWVASNTNLGIVLLLAPLARAAFQCLAAGRGEAAARTVDAIALRAALRHALEASTVEDAAHVYAAIRLASPGGLGRVNAEDVGAPPTRSLLEVMRLAAERDGVAREYATAFETTFELAAPALTRARRDGLPWDAATVETFLTVLAARPDTHVARRAGTETAVRVTRLASAAMAAGGVRTEPGRRTIADMDRAIRDRDHRANPGTTADLTAAAIFVVLLGGGWRADRPAAS